MHDGKIIKLKLSQMNYVKLRGQSEIEGRSMSQIIRDALSLYYVMAVPYKPRIYDPEKQVWETSFFGGWDGYSGTIADRIAFEEFMKN